MGRPGRDVVRAMVPKLCDEFSVDFVIANAENAAGGLGVTPDILDALFKMGVHGITLGNHTWRRRSFVSAIDRYPAVVRPANYPDGTPGHGATVIELDDGRSLGLINVLGRVFMEPLGCPFETVQAEIDRLKSATNTILVDVHAEATSEKVALGWFLDGRCTAVVGNHTHVQTADERVLPKGTAYITDVGMTGPMDSVIGVEPENVIRKFRTGLPTEFKVAKDRPGLCGVVIESDDATGRATRIERVARFH